MDMDNKQKARCAHWITSRAVTQGSGGRVAHRVQRCTRFAKAGSTRCPRHTKNENEPIVLALVDGEWLPVV